MSDGSNDEDLKPGDDFVDDELPERSEAWADFISALDRSNLPVALIRAMTSALNRVIDVHDDLWPYLCSGKDRVTLSLRPSENLGDLETDKDVYYEAWYRNQLIGTAFTEEEALREAEVDFLDDVQVRRVRRKMIKPGSRPERSD